MKPLPDLLAVRDPDAPALSVVIPFYNERDVLPECMNRVCAALRAVDLPAEVVLVDDGSTDGSAELALDHRAAGVRLRVLRLSRNFGKEAAMTAGLDCARGEATIVLDADLQDPPELIPQMVKAWRDGADVVLMQRRSRAGDSLPKRLSAWAFYRLQQRLCPSPMPVDTGDFRLMSRQAVHALRQLRERNRYMKGLYAWVGMPTVVLQYDRCPRSAGTSKWGPLALLGLAFDGITSFSTAPLRLATLIGLLTALSGAAFGLWIVLKAMMLGDPVAGYPSLVALMTFFGGVQLLGIGLVGEYVGKTYIEAKQRPNYIVRDVLRPRGGEVE